eukprot:TRINITY_DN5206_c0_g1_i2.p1 TRINITY_DN5206_c0_g1~~TRINITY_DN5206_c0_g1_i2.p1  ORF type:complete len:626 (+),score=226.31 TRINITY_DN5206_c0_g1_i2:52-1929(+)
MAGGKKGSKKEEVIEVPLESEIENDQSHAVENLYFGLEFNCVPDLVETLEDNRNEFDFIVVPLGHPKNERNLLNPQGAADEETFARSDTLLNSSQWSSFIIGKISNWIDLDSVNESTRRNSERVLLQELSWAAHLNLPSIVLPTPSFDSTNYAHIVHRKLQGLMYMQMWLRIPLMSTWQSIHGEDNAPLAPNGKPIHDPWEHWNNFKTLCDQHASLSVALELTEDLPGEGVLKRWLGEPVKAVIIPTKIFMTNKSGFPVLSKRHQQFLIQLFRYKIQYILNGTPKHKGGMPSYRQYVQFLYSKSPPLSAEESFEAPYLDYLQAPLQPLMDNLESQTYETFERDPIKYRLYEDAVYQALVDLKKNKDATKTHVTLMVVGAGRGPLVRASLRASTRAAYPIKVYAVEKNPNAVITLKNLKLSSSWGDMVTIVDSDMRVWNAPEQADILVSELLGSFGDNELSPECLDGAQRFLKEGGISIPTSYTSYLAPITSSKLWNEVKAWKEAKSFETPYVVKLHNFYQLDEAKECFTFVHPNKEDPIDNERYRKISFLSKESATIHGLAGYFDSHLYGTVHMSINPATFSTGMFSWFPLYFPLRVSLMNSFIKMILNRGNRNQCTFQVGQLLK